MSLLGNEQNVTKQFSKWKLDAYGVQYQYDMRNLDQHDLASYDSSVRETIEKLHENGEDAVNLNFDTFHFALEDYEFVFVDFYAPWCPHCQICKSVPIPDEWNPASCPVTIFEQDSLMTMNFFHDQHDI